MQNYLKKNKKECSYHTELSLCALGCISDFFDGSRQCAKAIIDLRSQVSSDIRKWTYIFLSKFSKDIFTMNKNCKCTWQATDKRNPIIIYISPHLIFTLANLQALSPASSWLASSVTWDYESEGKGVGWSVCLGWLC